MVRVSVPATSANLGPGFDTMGLALDLWNTFSMEEARTSSVTIEGEGAEELRKEGTGMVLEAAAFAFRRKNVPMPALKVEITSRIPVGRGLGSSATATLAGVLGANALLEARFSPEEVLDMASRLEGHADNAAPALHGGITLTWKDQSGRFRVFPIRHPRGIKAVLSIPKNPLLTTVSRAALPVEVPFQDAVFNLTRAALLVGGLMSGELDMLTEAMRDRLHEPYRAPLASGYREAATAALRAGAYGACLSGSGPSVLALVKDDAARAVGAAMAEAMAEAGVPARISVLSLNAKGAHVEAT